MKFAVMQGVLGESLSDVFRVTGELGFDGVELDWGDPEAAQEGGLLGPDRRDAIRQAAEDAGVEIPSVCAHFLNGGGLASPDSLCQQSAMQAIRAGIGLCRDLGAGALLVPFFGEGTIEGPEGIARLEANLKPLAPEAESAQVTLAIEHSLPAAEASKLLSSINSPRIGDYWDMANCLCFGYDPLDEIKDLGHWLVCVHAKEYDGGAGSKGTQAAPRYDGLNTKPFGQGQAPVAKILTALRQSHYGGWVVLETGTFGDRRESARAALDVLKQALP